MKRLVKQSIPSSGITQQNFLKRLQDSVVPVIREIRRIVNSRFGDVVTITDDYQIGQYEEIIIVDTSGGAIDVYLPSIVNYSRTVIIKRYGGNNVTVYPHSDDAGVLIDGAASVDITVDLYALQIITDGEDWYTVNYS